MYTVSQNSAASKLDMCEYQIAFKGDWCKGKDWNVKKVSMKGKKHQTCL